jgi:MFS family permease
MPVWKNNLIVCWFGIFTAAIGMSQIAPVLPLYIRHLGVINPASIARLSGFAFGITFILSAVFSPVWGHAADIYGRKPMLLRASLGMAIIVFSMGYAPNVAVLIGLRLLMGVIAGYGTACTTLIATQTDKANAGYALGTLSTANIAGSLIGPMIGGSIAEAFGLQNVFFMTGGLLLISFITTALFVKEDFKKQDTKTPHMLEVWKKIPEKSLTMTMFVTFFILTVALYSVEPIITVYISKLSKDGSHIALMSGIAFSAAGLANILAAPWLGKLSDKIGPQKVMLGALFAAGILFIPQAFVSNPWQLIALRFLLGLTLGGLIPSVNTMIKRITPNSLTGRVFGFSMSAGYLGVFAGAVLGGQIAAWLGPRYVFIFTSALLLLNGCWVYLKVYRKLNLQANKGNENGGITSLQPDELDEIIISK